MTRSRIDRHLSAMRRDGTPTLAPGFAPSVLEQARRMKRALILHRRALAIATLIGIGAAFFISTKVVRAIPLVPPPSEAFSAPGFTIPPQMNP